MATEDSTRLVIWAAELPNLHASRREVHAKRQPVFCQQGN